MSGLLNVDWSTIPAPTDDGAAKHLLGAKLPRIALQATDGTKVDVGSLGGRTVIYAYPMTGVPGTPLPEGWDMFPGARGCTPQSCAFRDHAAELRSAGVNQIYGLSVQSNAYQTELAQRLHLPFSLLSDEQLIFTTALKLPTFAIAGMTLNKRVTLIAQHGLIEHVFYPIFPPDQNAPAVADWLLKNRV
jgi:peroxiredoxin